MSQFIWLVPFFPLLGFIIIGLFNKNIPRNISGIIASVAVLASFIVSIGIFFDVHNGGGGTYEYFDWIQAGNLKLSLSFLVDPLSSLMLLIITGVGFLIHLYSIGYMHDDEGVSRFFAYLNLFIVFMLLLVLGSNYIVMFAGWEGVGLCSYLLIGFWFKNTSYNNAAKKAFIMNRIGDLGFLLGVFLIFTYFGSLDFAVVFAKASTVPSGTLVITAITMLLFIGAMGKSAQIPLYTWLPDAMAGPTPVSALIHAATMVTAGIYMIVRSNILYSLAPATLSFVACIGAATAIFAATIGLFQNDIKKVLAYSTVSQLGYMFVALGLGCYTSGMFHVTTHAFFKALLFLGAGSVIHAMSGEQDIRNMGGLRKALPITFATFLIGTLAISGIPPFAGFFSKDEILTKAYEHNFFIYIVLTITSALTAFYMFRLLFLTFYGSFRGTEDQKHHLHESPKSITIPLIVLAVLSAVGGFMGVPHVLGGSHALNKFLSPIIYNVGLTDVEELNAGTEYTLMAVTLAILATVILFARNMFIQRNRVPSLDESNMPAAQRVVYNKYYIDELYNTLFVKPLNVISEVFYKIFDVRIIDFVVNSFGRTTQFGGRTLRLIQTGNIGFYIYAMVAGIILILLTSFIL